MPSARLLAVLAVVALGSCMATDSPTAGPASRQLDLGFRPAIIPSPSNATALPINRIRASAVRVADDVEIGETVEDVDPAAAEWAVDLSIDASGAVSVVVTVYLIHVTVDGSESVEFSGQVGPITAGAGAVAPDVPIARGPLANLATTSVTIASAPPVLGLGATATLVAATTSEDGSQATVFWASLDADVVSMEGDVATAVGVGAAEVVASAGSYADTVTIQVVDPDSIAPQLVSTMPAADATGVVRSVTVTATFDEDIDPATVTDATFVLEDSTGAVVPAAASAAGPVASLTPADALEPSHRYTVVLGPGIADPAGNAVADPFTWSFTTGGLAVLDGSFDADLGTLVSIGFDDVSGQLYIHDAFSDTIRVYDQTGTETGPSLPRPGVSANDIDLDFTQGAAVLGSTQLPSNTLLVHNGEASPGTLYAVDKIEGVVLDSLVIANGGNVVGGAFHPRRLSYFAVSWNTDQISEVDLTTGDILNTFPVQPPGATPYDVFYGDLEVDPASGDLYLVSSYETRLRVLTPEGAWVEDYDVGTAGVTGMSGIAWDAANGIAWISSTTGQVYRVNGIGPG